MREKLLENFPKHRMRIELFFGAGGSFFYLPTPKFSVLNDADDDVTNLYLTLLNKKEELKRQVELLPISAGLIKHWKKNNETDPIKKALRFLLLSNFTYLGKGDTIRFGIDNTKKNLIDRIEPTFEKLQNCKIMTEDFRNVLPKISFNEMVTPKSECFIYLDPVYLDTDHYYRVPNWSKNDTEDCFKIMAESGIKCAMSEFNNPIVLGLAKKYQMNVKPLIERQNINNRKIEILITNYTPESTLSLFEGNLDYQNLDEYQTEIL